MNDSRPSRAPARGHAVRWVAAGVLCAGAAACTELPAREQLGCDVEAIAAQLVETAQARSDLRQARVWVAEIHETRPRTTRAGVREAHEDVLGLRLEHEFVIALAGRMNVVETEIAEPAVTAGASAALDERAAARGATHVLVGDYVRRDGTLLIAVRLIDAETRLIVAAARGEVRLDDGGSSELGRWSLSAGEAHDPPPIEVVVLESSATAPQIPAPGATGAATPAPPGETQGSSPGPADTAPPPARSAPQSTPAPRSTVEDFETWRKRRQAEQGAVPEAPTVSILAGAAAQDTAGMLRARRHELLSPPPGEAAEPFPWRRYAWLARLLGVPAEPPVPR